MLKRKVNLFLNEWKNRKHKPLIVKGLRQVGKTTSIREFAKQYKSFVEINFVTNPEYKSIFKYGFDPEKIVKEISLLNPKFNFIENDTLIFFDEIQEYIDATTSLKFFAEQNKYDVICSGSSLGVNYKKVSSVSVGYKEDYDMTSMDFEEFLWANGYSDEHIKELFNNMLNLVSLSKGVFDRFNELYSDYLYCGGMPEIVNYLVTEKTYTHVFSKQKQIYMDFENDITKYVEGLDASKVKNMYRHITPQLAKDNHKYQITKLGHGARSREYIGCADWLKDAGIINIAYNLENLSFPFSANESIDDYRIYYADTSLFIATLDEESKNDIVRNKNYGIYNGAIYENMICESLLKQGYNTYFYKNDDSTIELDFVIRVKNEIVPIEVKSNRGRSKSLNTILNSNTNNIKYGVKLSNNNIGFDGKIFTFPYFMSFKLKQFFELNDKIKW